MQEYCDYIRKNLTRDKIAAHLENAGFAVYDKEGFDELTFALAEHCVTEGIDPGELAA